MRYGAISGVGARISQLVLGSDIISAERANLANSLLDTFVEAGGTAIDTARSYGNGTSEAVIGDWLRSRGGRDKLTIITKGAHPLEDGGVPRVTPAAIAGDLIRSLELLQIDRIDLYLLHRDDRAQDVGPIVDVLGEAQSSNRIRAAGASNWTTARIVEANEYAACHGRRGFTVGSQNLALAVPSEPMWPGCVSIAGDPAALAWYQEHQFPNFCWSSQASGFFSGRFSPDEITDQHVARVYYRHDNWERLRRARELASLRGCTPTQVALAWTLHQSFPTFALIGPRTVPELQDCLGALNVELSPSECAWLNLELESRS
jgi:aryl-alcohol dehydrogenase-like predicted oxidoreductase